ncbi:hypothetical protein CHS0354_008249 [Potamilus streckersoni]|uniref:Uncharacterized protein n=1 Tax=Potamilus streckersoni TaxID=2493646 RepID=A0AAE0W909_9BIVA|nr:hypothetical protein CHS0354_008249 [Potamilus streckersoni]
MLCVVAAKLVQVYVRSTELRFDIKQAMHVGPAEEDAYVGFIEGHNCWARRKIQTVNELCVVVLASGARTTLGLWTICGARKALFDEVTKIESAKITARLRNLLGLSGSKHLIEKHLSRFN